MTWLCPGMKCSNQVRTTQLCEDCRRYLPILLLEIPVLWTRARLMLAATSNARPEKVSTSTTGSRAPLNLGILEATDTATGVLSGWVAAMKIRRKEPPSIVEPEADALRHNCEYLSTVHEDLADSPLLVDLYNSIYRVRRALHLIAGDCPEVLRLAEPCPVCENRALIQRRGDDYIRCLTCSGWWGQSAYLNLNDVYRS